MTVNPNERTHLRAPWTQAALDLLADHQWHDREQLVATITAHVPPGVAYRQGETRRLGRGTTGDGTRTRGSDQDSIRAGARTIATRTLFDLVRRHQAERSTDRTRYRATTGR